MHPAPRILISAGEPSGDLHGAALVPELRARFPDVRIDALGGARLAAAGVELLHVTTERSVLGGIEVLSSLPRHFAMLRELEAPFRSGRYDLLITVDYPGFNLRLAERAHRRGVPVLSYIAPKHWATRSRLTPRYATSVDRVACILPFEPEYFAPFGIRAEYVGHPLLDRPPLPGRVEARESLGIGAADRVLVLFPGSRAQEVERLWPAFRDAGLELQRRNCCERILVAALPGLRYTGNYPIEVMEGCPEWLLASADAAIAKSGTTTLEAALAGLPMVVAYRMHPATAWMARRMLKVPWISLVNLLAGRETVPELLQERATSQQLSNAVEPLLSADSTSRRAQLDGFEAIRTMLGGPGAARRVAGIAAELLGAS